MDRGMNLHSSIHEMDGAMDHFSQCKEANCKSGHFQSLLKKRHGWGNFGSQHHPPEWTGKLLVHNKINYSLHNHDLDYIRKQFVMFQ